MKKEPDLAKTKLIVAALLMGGLGVGTAQAKGDYNPVDQQSNQQELRYDDVGIAPEDMKPIFVRDGIVRDPAGFRAVAVGLSEEEIEAMLGAPLTKANDEWDFNFKFAMPQSDNYLVCQYKVRFDAEKKVEAGVWRRRQCEALVNAAPAA